MPASAAPLATGIISGDRRKSRDEVNDRARLIAGGLAALGIRPGDSVGILMRNDIAFLEAAYAVMMLGAYAMPVNWHFKADEIAYVMEDSGARVLIGHADLLHGLHGIVPPGVTMLSVSPPPEIVDTYRIDRARLEGAPGALDFDAWLAKQMPYDGPALPQPQNMIYTSAPPGIPRASNVTLRRLSRRHRWKRCAR